MRRHVSASRANVADRYAAILEQSPAASVPASTKNEQQATTTSD
jgi:hypothetical protein